MVGPCYFEGGVLELEGECCNIQGDCYSRKGTSWASQLAAVSHHLV